MAHRTLRYSGNSSALKMERAFFPKAVLLFVVVCLFICPAFAAEVEDIPEAAIKIPPMVQEYSVSTYVPSESAPGKGLAINIIYPRKPRYADGAPVAVIVPGGSGGDGLSFDAHTSQGGFVEVRFAFPGSGLAKFSSSGIYDYRGVESQKALKDILLFAAGKIADRNGAKINDLVPIKIAHDNLGIIGWSNGGNIALVTMAKYADDLQFISWIGFYESPLGSMFFPPNLGGVDDLVINKHYRQGSGATGDCLVDYSKLTFEPDFIRRPGEHKKRGEAELPGVLYFDENGNNRWDEPIEFAFNYASDVGLDKQIYPPDVTQAIEQRKLFNGSLAVRPREILVGSNKPTLAAQYAAAPKKIKNIYDVPITFDAIAQPAPVKDSVSIAGMPHIEPPATVGCTAVLGTKLERDSHGKPMIVDYSLNMESLRKASGNGRLSHIPKITYHIRKDTPVIDLPDPAPQKTKTEITSVLGIAFRKEVPVHIPQGKQKQVVVWPDTIATLKESEAYFEERDGSLYIPQVAQKFPHLLVSMFASEVDHMQRQADHPHIALAYNAWLANKVGWLRLNPDPSYIAFMAFMNRGNFKNNAPMTSIDSSQIADSLEPEGLVPDYVYMEAIAAELADRKRTKNLRSNISAILCPYDNGLHPPPPVKK